MQHTEPDVDRMQFDMEQKGWLAKDLAAAADVPKARVTRFFQGKFQTAPTFKALAEALGRSTRYYTRAIRKSA